MTYLIVTVRFLDDRYHGLLGRGGPPEWPPSPFRLFQALVAGVARRGELVIGDDVPSNRTFTPIGQALDWLQRRTREHPPMIVGPKARTGQAITRFVPNNDGDKKFDRQERLTAKPTIPTLFILEREQMPEVHYVWPIEKSGEVPVDRIRDAARSLTTLGWGIDMAFADARRVSEDEVQGLKGVRWRPKRGTGAFRDSLRAPTHDDELGECTLSDLRQCHSTFINRIEHGKPLKTVDKPKVFDRVLYTSVERPAVRPCAVFKLLDENGDPARYAHSRLIHIAGMVRHLAKERLRGDPPSFVPEDERATWLGQFVCGHRGDADQHQQISYVPLPSIGHQHADAMIRNVMLIAPIACEQQLEYVADRINGDRLIAEGNESDESASTPNPGTPETLERFIPSPGRFIAIRYLGTSRVWVSVTPVILDGHNRKSRAEKPEAVARRTVGLIRTALERAGIETPCEFTWQSVPFFNQCLSAHKYERDGRHTGYHRPQHLRTLTAVHLRLTFAHPLPGPLTVGAGRHCGFGLMATEYSRE